MKPKAGEDLALFRARLAQAVGSPDELVINHLLAHAAYASERDGSPAEKCNTAAALLAGIGPRDELEGMLAVQMIGCHNMAMAMTRTALKTDRVDWMATYVNLSAKLMNAYTRQLEALARLRGQTGQQTVRVEHVTVQAGGQAVVGNVTPRGGWRTELRNNPLHREDVPDPAAPERDASGCGTATRLATLDGWGLITISGGNAVGVSVNNGINFTVENLTIADGDGGYRQNIGGGGVSSTVGR